MTLAPRFDSVEAFLAMGGHAPFVWGAWGLTTLVIVWLAAWALTAQARWKARVETLERAHEAASSAARAARADAGEAR